jgi:hypothetical protein
MNALRPIGFGDAATRAAPDKKPRRMVGVRFSSSPSQCKGITITLPGTRRRHSAIRSPAVTATKGHFMRFVLLMLAMMLTAGAARAQNLVPPEIVRLENVQIEAEGKTIYVGNADKHYLLFCNTKAAGCITPEENKNYLLFNKDTHWKMPGAKTFIDLAWLQDWTVTYDKGENIGLVPEGGGSPDQLGMYVLDPTGGGYEADTIISDGPIIYGTGMSFEDRAKTWKQFWYQMVEAVMRQQGKEALTVKMAKRCMPGQDICTIGLGADFVGIGGIKEPRKVLLLVAFDLHNKDKQLSRTVCTYPAKGTIICRRGPGAFDQPR